MTIHPTGGTGPAVAAKGLAKEQVGFAPSKAGDQGAAEGTGKAGSLTVIEGGTYSESEMNAANYMKNFGNNVTLRPPTGQGRTSDLLVNGIKYDVYTPETNNVSQIISKMAKKNSQANGIMLDLSKTNVTPDQLSNALARVKGAVESQGKVCNINDIVIMPK